MSAAGAGGIAAVGIVLWLSFRTPRAVLVFGAVGMLVGGILAFLNYDWRRMWPSQVALTPVGITFRFPRRPTRSISWDEVRHMAVMPATTLTDEWLRIWYRDRGEETQLYVIGQTAHALVGEFQRRMMTRWPGSV